MIRAGGSNEANSPRTGPKTIRAGGRNASVPPIRTALGTGFSLNTGQVIIPNISVSIGDLLVAGTSADIDFGPSGIDLNGIQLTLRLFQGSFTVGGSIWAWKVTQNVVNGTITVNGQAATACSIVLSKFTPATSGIVRASASTGALPNTTDPDSGLASLSGLIPQIHYGIIATQGGSADTLGAWQNGMTAGQVAGGAFPCAQTKEGYRIPLSAVQARAQIIGQTSRESCALVVCFA